MINAPTVATDDLFLILYCAIDDLYADVAPPSVQHRPGIAEASMTDAEVICLSVMQEGRSNSSEASFHREVTRNHAHLFPDLISRSRYNRRRRALMGVQRELVRVLMEAARTAATWLMVDSAPITVAKSPRWKSAQMTFWAAEAGYAPSKQQFFLGFRLHALVSNQGLLCDFVLTAANASEREVAQQMLATDARRPDPRVLTGDPEALPDRPVLADNGYCGDWLEGLFGKQGGRLWYALRRQKAPKTALHARLRAWHRGKRARIESVFAALTDQFNVETTRALSTWGVMTRVAAKLLAYMLGVAVNDALGRPRTALKSLYR